MCLMFAKYRISKGHFERRDISRKVYSEKETFGEIDFLSKGFLRKDITRKGNFEKRTFRERIFREEGYYEKRTF